MSEKVPGRSPDFVHIGDRHMFQGHIWHVVTGEFRGPSGETFSRDIVRSPGAVGIVPLLEVGSGTHDVVLLRQYRAAFDDYVIEIPAGMRDVEGEHPETTARRELLEETGYRAGTLELLHVFYPSPGMTDSTLHIYLGRDLEVSERAAHGPEEIDMEVFTVALDEAVEMAVSGLIRDAKSVIGLLIAHRSLSTR